MSTGLAQQARIWRTAVSVRIGSVVVLLGWLALSLGITFGAGVADGVLVLIWVLGPVYGFGAWRYAFVPFVALRTSDVLVRNRWGQQVIPYGDIASVHPGYYGTTFRLKTGSSVTAWAVQKPNWASWLHRRTRADDLSDAITERLPVSPFDSDLPQ